MKECKDGKVLKYSNHLHDKGSSCFASDIKGRRTELGTCQIEPLDV